MDRLQYSLTYEGITTILEVAPVSWDKSILKTERQIGVWGVTRAFQFQFEFVKDGADILRNAFYNNGIEADVTILIEKFNYISHEYEQLYSGKINFAKFIDDTVSVKVDAIEGNLPQLLKANENTKYQITYNDFYRHYQILKDSYKYNQPQINYSGVTAYTQSYIVHPIKMTKNEVIENIGEIIEAYNPSNSTGIQFDTFLYPFDDTNDILLCLKNCNISLDIDIKYFWGRLFLEQDTAGFIKFNLRIYLYRYSSTLGTWGIVKIKTDTVSVSSSIYYTAYDHYVQWQEVLNVSLGDGDKLAMMAVVDADWEHSRVSAEVEDGYLLVNKFNVVIGNDAYNIPCINLTNLLTNLGNKITNNLTGIESTYFADKNIILFSGNAIRGFPNATLNISFNDVFKFLNGCYGAGFGVENNKIVIENRGYFFEDSEIEEFTNSNDFSIEHAEELIYNTVKVGNNSPTIEGKYGNYEPNNQLAFALPITKIKKELNLISPIRTDSLGIDALRVAQNFSNSDSKDNANDNEIFAVVCKPLDASEVSFFANILPPGYFIEIRIRIKDGGSYVSTDVTVTFGNGTVKNLTSYTQLDGYKDWYIYSTGYTVNDVNDSVLVEWNNNVDIKYINDNNTIMYGFYEALKSDYTITSGVPSDISADIFNKSLSPKRCLINNSDLLNTALYKQPQSNEVTFLSSLKNNAMVSGGLTENAALKRSEFNAAIFDPIYYNATVPVSADTWQKILNTPKGYFSVWYKDVKYLGYILEASLNSAVRSEMKIKLLAKTPAIVPIPEPEIPSPLFWINSSNANNYELIDGKVATAYDLSNNKTNVVQAIADARPSIESISGKDYFKFDGVDDFLTGGNICNLNTIHHNIYIVYKTLNTANGSLIAKSFYGVRSDKYAILHGGDSLPQNKLNYFFANEVKININPISNFNILEIDYKNETIKMIVNNVVVNEVIITSYLVASLYDFLIGAYNNNAGSIPPQSGFYFHGYIGEIIIYNTEISESQRLIIYNYLKNKWGL